MEVIQQQQKLDVILVIKILIWIILVNLLAIILQLY